MLQTAITGPILPHVEQMPRINDIEICEPLVAAGIVDANLEIVSEQGRLLPIVHLYLRDSEGIEDDVLKVSFVTSLQGGIRLNCAVRLYDLLDPLLGMQERTLDAVATELAQRARVVVSESTGPNQRHIDVCLEVDAYSCKKTYPSDQVSQWFGAAEAVAA